MLAIVLTTMITAVPAIGPMNGASNPRQVMVPVFAQGAAEIASSGHGSQGSTRNAAQDSMNQGQYTDSDKQQLGN